MGGQKGGCPAPRGATSAVAFRPKLVHRGGLPLGVSSPVPLHLGPILRPPPPSALPHPLPFPWSVGYIPARQLPGPALEACTGESGKRYPASGPPGSSPGSQRVLGQAAGTPCLGHTPTDCPERCQDQMSACQAPHPTPWGGLGLLHAPDLGLHPPGSWAPRVPVRRRSAPHTPGAWPGRAGGTGTRCRH